MAKMITVADTIEITCSTCRNKFRWKPIQKFNSTIKPKAPTECNVCKNRKLLLQSSLYRNNKSKPANKVNRPVKKENRLKSKITGNIDDKLDKAWSLLVKLKAGHRCEKCGGRKSLNSHHIYSRAKKAVRWYVPNGICLCVNHHIGVDFSAHKTPTDFTYWLEQKKGTEFMDQLRIKAHQTSYLHEFEKEILLKELQSEIKHIQNSKKN